MLLCSEIIKIMRPAGIDRNVYNIICSYIGGRQIEVKFISTTLPTDVFGGDASSKDEDDLSNDEAKQFQSMIYNLMVSSENLQYKTKQIFKFIHFG